MSSQAIISITCKEYKPTFDIVKDEYYDESPVNKNERNSIIYTCPCKSGSNLRKWSDFMSHFDTDHHKSYLRNYSNIVENEENEKNEKNELKKENELLKRKLINRENENEKLKKEYEILNEKYMNMVRKCGAFATNMTKNKKKIDKLKQENNNLKNIAG